MYTLSVENKKCTVNKEFMEHRNVNKHWKRVNKYKYRGYTIDTEGYRYLTINIIGEANSGKTTYIRALHDNPPSFIQDDPPLIVQNYSNDSYGTIQALYQNIIYTIKLPDGYNQSSIPDKYVNGTIVMYDVNNELTNLESIDTLRKSVKKLGLKHTVMVANKCDTEPSKRGNISISALNKDNLLEPLNHH